MLTPPEKRPGAVADDALPVAWLPLLEEYEQALRRSQAPAPEAWLREHVIARIPGSGHDE